MQVVYLGGDLSKSRGVSERDRHGKEANKACIIKKLTCGSVWSFILGNIGSQDETLVNLVQGVIPLLTYPRVNNPLVLLACLVCRQRGLWWPERPFKCIVTVWTAESWARVPGNDKLQRIGMN